MRNISAAKMKIMEILAFFKISRKLFLEILYKINQYFTVCISAFTISFCVNKFLEID